MNAKTISLSLMLLAFLPSVMAMESGLNYYDTFDGRLNISKFNETYQQLFVMDDIGTCANTPSIADIDNDGINELIVPEYYGRMRVWNWSGMIRGQRESQDLDRGTYYISTAQNGWIVGGDNDGDGYLELAVNDYNGYMNILEYDGSSWTLLYKEPADRGYYRSSPLWCDIDGDGDLDVFTCTYEGYCRLYDYRGGTYNLNYTSGDLGTFHYSCHPSCGDFDNDGSEEIMVNDYNGFIRVFNFSAGVFSHVASYGDYGSYYSPPHLGDFLGDGFNYTITCASDGTCRAFNCTAPTKGLDGCVEMDRSNDIGSIYYGGGELLKKRINGKDYLFGSETQPYPIMVELVDATTLTITNKAMYIGGEAYTSIGMPNASGSNHQYILYNNRYDADVASAVKTGTWSWTTMKLEKDVQGRIYAPSYYYGFLYTSGWACGQLDYSTPEDECVIISYDGIPYVYTLQNITEFRTDIYSDYELAFLDIMPRDATQYLIGNKTYCVNENKNVLLHSIGGGKIDPWVNVYDDEGAAIPNENRITDGVLSTASYFHDQNSADRTFFDGGTDQWFEMNFSKPVHIGQITFWGNFGSEYDPLNLKVQISNTNCDSPNFNTVFDETSGDITGASTYLGTRIRFIPQDVMCIRITASGARYSSASYTSSNYVTEVGAYYANNCTFYAVPLDALGGNVNEDYNSSITVYPNKLEDSPNQMDNNYESPIISAISFLLKCVSRLIVWVVT